MARPKLKPLPPIRSTNEIAFDYLVQTVKYWDKEAERAQRMKALHQEALQKLLTTHPELAKRSLKASTE